MLHFRVISSFLCWRNLFLRALRQTLQVWLDTYTDDFRTPPHYSALQQLKQFTSEHLKGSDLDVKVHYKLEKIVQEQQEKGEIFVQKEAIGALFKS